MNLYEISEAHQIERIIPPDTDDDYRQTVYGALGELDPVQEEMAREFFGFAPRGSRWVKHEPPRFERPPEPMPAPAPQPGPGDLPRPAKYIRPAELMEFFNSPPAPKLVFPRNYIRPVALFDQIVAGIKRAGFKKVGVGTYRKKKRTIQTCNHLVSNSVFYIVVK